MKNYSMITLLLGLLFASTGFVSCDESAIEEPTESTDVLTEAEIADLRFMREEEKLARDVYLYFKDNYDVNIFGNISSSEQTHMDAVLDIMNKYDIEDMTSNELGVFSNVSLQKLYNDLIAQGNESLIGALTAGATIEDVDIRDLTNAIDATTNTDLVALYEMLACGSRNHMRAFTKNLNNRGETYTPQFITQVEYDAVVNGAHEQCGG